MKLKKLMWPVFILMALAQIYIPASMILGREDILNNGKEFRFKTAPIDPTDPFRGKYITLRFDRELTHQETNENWNSDEVLYVTLYVDTNGFAQVKDVLKEEPSEGDYVKAKARYYTFKNSSNKSSLTIDYPFDRYYMEESKAYEAEKIYRDSRVDTNQIAYAVVRIKKGESVLQDVLINGTPIREVVLQHRTEE